MSKIEAIVSDFGGVLTSPLMEAFLAIQDDHGVNLEELGQAMLAIAADDGKHPLFELEKGQLSEREFLKKMEQALTAVKGESISLHGFRESYFRALDPNLEMVALMRELKAADYRMALLTNNVREWEPIWRTKLPIDEIFELVVDSGFVGMRKPEPGIYLLLLDRLGLSAESCIFIDDVEVNCEAAEQLGMEPVHFKDTEQAVAEIRSCLKSGSGQEKEA